MKTKAAVLLAFAALLLESSTPARGQQPAVFEILVPAESLNLTTGLTVPGGSEPYTLRQFLAIITVRANGAVCLTADVASGKGDVLLQIGLPGQASPCTMDGSELTFNDGSGGQLAARMTLRNGTRETLRNLAPMPPGRGTNLGPRVPPRVVFPPSPPAPRPITPPQAGDAGLLVRASD